MMKEINVSVETSLITVTKQMALCIKAASDPAKNVGWHPYNEGLSPMPHRVVRTCRSQD